jgi:hypothetical protein
MRHYPMYIHPVILTNSKKDKQKTSCEPGICDYVFLAFVGFIVFTGLILAVGMCIRLWLHWLGLRDMFD